MKYHSVSTIAGGERHTYLYHTTAGEPHKVYRTEKDGGKTITQQRGRKDKLLPWGDISSQELYIVEGEKCALWFINKGIPATTWAMGSGAWDKTDWSGLKGKSVILIPDNDEPGRQSMEELSQHLLDICRKVIILDYNPRDWPEKWDVADLSSVDDEEEFWARSIERAVFKVKKGVKLDQPISAVQEPPQDFYGEDTFNDLKQVLRGVRPVSGGEYYSAFCPVHDNKKTRALTFGLKNDKTWAKCNNPRCGAGTNEVIKAAGLWKAVNSSTPPPITTAAVEVAEQVLEVKGVEFQGLNWEELCAQTSETMSWLVGECIPEGGFFILTAKPKKGKSTLLRQMGMAVSNGLDFLGRPTKAARVLYCGFEDGAQNTRIHYQKIIDNTPGIDYTNLTFIVDPPNVHEQVEKLVWLKRHIQHYRAELVLLDPLMFFLNVDDANNYAEMLKILRPLKQMGAELGCSIGTAHHSRKSDGEDTLDTCLGSTAIAGTFESIFLMKSGKEENTAIIESRQRSGTNFAPSYLKMDVDRKVFNMEGDKSEVDVGGLMKQFNQFFWDVDNNNKGRVHHKMPPLSIYLKNIAEDLDIDEDKIFTVAELQEILSFTGGRFRQVLSTALDRPECGWKEAGEGKKGKPLCYYPKGLDNTAGDDYLL